MDDRNMYGLGPGHEEKAQAMIRSYLLDVGYDVADHENVTLAKVAAWNLMSENEEVQASSSKWGINHSFQPNCFAAVDSLWEAK